MLHKVGLLPKDNQEQVRTAALSYILTNIYQVTFAFEMYKRTGTVIGLMSAHTLINVQTKRESSKAVASNRHSHVR
jgi:20S proteasome alpha/beta subunit